MTKLTIFRPHLQEAKAEGSSVTVETCAHYLAFAAEDIPEGATQYKCAPPIRDSRNRELLWKALLVRHGTRISFFSFFSFFCFSLNILLVFMLCFFLCYSI